MTAEIIRLKTYTLKISGQDFEQVYTALAILAQCQINAETSRRLIALRDALRNQVMTQNED